MDSRRMAWFVVLVIFLVQELAGSQYVNVALGKPTKQKSTHSVGDSSHAVDGNRNSNYINGNSCTHTLNGTNLWWMVDLLQSYYIHSVDITNRNDWQERLQNFTIYVSNVNPLPLPHPYGKLIGEVCLYYSSHLPKNGPHRLNCNSKTSGRFVYLWKAMPKDALTICEFEVMVSKEDLNLRQQTFTVSPGRKSLMSPFYSQIINFPSSVKCVSVCFSATGGVATVIQLERATRMCQCIETRFEEESSSGITEAAGWILIK